MRRVVAKKPAWLRRFKFFMIAWVAVNAVPPVQADFTLTIKNLPKI